MKQVGIAVVGMLLLVIATKAFETVSGDSAWFNNGRHILFGIIAAWGTKAFFRWRGPERFDATPAWLQWVMALGGFSIWAVAWEIYEFRAGTVRANPWVLDPYNDTVWDLEHGLIGAVAGMLIPVLKEKEKGKVAQDRSA